MADTTTPVKYLDQAGALYMLQKIKTMIPDVSGMPNQAITNEEIDAMFASLETPTGQA